MHFLSERAAGFIFPLIVIGLGLGLFAGTLHNPYIGDDVILTQVNPYSIHLSKVPTYFVSDFDLLVDQRVTGPIDQPSRYGIYRPILATSYAVNRHLFGLEPFGWRLTNLVLHLAVSLLVLALARRLLASWLGALIAAVLFVIHPVHTEAVATLIGGRSELLAAAFVLASWLVYLVGEERSGGRRWLWNLGSAGLFALGLLSKENAVVLPAIIFLAGWTLRGKNTRDLLINLIPHLAVFTLYVIVRLAVVGRIEAADRSVVFGDAGPLSMVLTLLFIQAMYLRLALVPFPLQYQMCYRNIPATASAATSAAAALVLVGLIGIAAWYSIRSRGRARPPIWAFGTLLFFLCLVPVSHLIPHFVVMAERFLYLPSVALCLVAGWLAIRAYSYRRWILPAAALPIMVACSIGTLSRNADWADPERFWKKIARCTPSSFEPYDAVGNVIMRRGRPAEAIPYFQKAAEMSPSSSSPIYNLGVAMQRLGRAREAEQYYRKALALEPNHPLALLNLGTLLEAKGDLAGAKQCYRSAARGDPTHPAPFVNLGNIMQQEGQYGEAERLFRLALRVAPGSIEARFNLGRLLGLQGKKEAARSLYLEILALDADHAMAHNNLANIMKDEGQTKSAESHYRDALGSEPDCVPCHYNLANLLLDRGDNAGAIEHFSRALALHPDKLEALIGLAYAQARMGKLSLAEETARRAEVLAPQNLQVRKLLEALRAGPR